MIRLVQLELQKLWLNKTSKVLIIIGFLLPFAVLVLSSIKINFFGLFTLELGELGIFNFPIIWHITTYFAAFAKFFFAIVVVSMIGNEYSNKTLKQNLIDGLSKREFILSKFYTIVIFSLIATLLIGITTFCIGMYYSSYTEANIIFREVEFLLAYFMKLLGFFSLCLFFAMWLKRSAFALAFLIVLWVTEWIITGIVAWRSDFNFALQIQSYFPLSSMSNLIDQPAQRVMMTKFPDKAEMAYDYAVHFSEIAIVLGWTALFIFLSYRLLKKRDL